MTLVINKRSSPPGDWWIQVPEIKMEVKGASFELLVENVITMLELNGYQAPVDPKQYVTDLLCSRMPPGYCTDTHPPPAKKGPSPGANVRYRNTKSPEAFAGQPTIKDIKKGFDTFYRWARAGRKLVSLREADRRGAICAQCIYNKPHRPCPTCSALYAAIRRLTTRRQTKHYEKLEVCLRCKCCNKTQTQIPMEHLRRQPHHRYPAHCWKREADIEQEAKPARAGEPG